jgi:hypothetical protein
MQKFVRFTVVSLRGKTIDFDVTPTIRKGVLRVPSAQFRLADVKNVVVKNRNEIIVDLVNSPPVSATEQTESVKTLLAAWNEEDYL